MAERGEYRSISRSLFSGKDFRRLSERCRWVFTVLKMNSGMVGLDTWYEAELHHRLAEETGATLDQVRLALEILEHENWIRREDNVLWVVGHLAHDPHLVPSNPKHRKSVQRHIAGLPRLAIVKAFVQAHLDWFPKDEAKTMGIEWVYDGYRKGTGRSSRTRRKGTDTHSIQEKEKEDDTEKDSASGDSGESSGNWVAEATSIWATEVAPVDYGKVGAWLKTLVDTHGWPAVEPALRKYIKANKGKARKLIWFAEDANRWLKYGPMGTTDDKGDLTEWGELMLHGKVS